MHELNDWCPHFWCRLHYWPAIVDGLQDYIRYPMTCNIKSSRVPSGWARVPVYCGPGAYFPKKAK